MDHNLKYYVHDFDVKHLDNLKHEMVAICAKWELDNVVLYQFEELVLVVVVCQSLNESLEGVGSHFVAG